MSTWAVKRDGRVVSLHESDSEAFGQLHRLQPNSVHHATTHEGWSIEPAEEPAGD